MAKLIIGIVVIWGALWLLGVGLRVLSELASAARQQWDRTQPERERVGNAVGGPFGTLIATMLDLRLISVDIAITLFVAALFLAGADSAALISWVDTLGGEKVPILGWAILGCVAGITMGTVSRMIELGRFSSTAILRVPDITHLHAGEHAAARYFNIRRFAAVGGAAVLLSALAFSYSKNSGYDLRAGLDKKMEDISIAGVNGKIALLNAALEDSTGRLQFDPKSGLRILFTLQGLSRDGANPEVQRVAKVAQKYLAVYREETEKAVSDGKPEALARSEAYYEIDHAASLRWQGRLYEAGWGGAKKDLSKAFVYFGSAAGAGDKSAATLQDKLAHVMVASKDEGIRQEVYKYLESKAQNGASSEQYWLGQWYVSSGKLDDQKNAEKWLSKALNQDSEAAIRNLAFSSLANLNDVGAAATKVLDELAPKYAKGNDETMKKTAYVYLEKRANASDPGSMLWLGFRHEEGDGVPKNAEKAHEWFLKAALQNTNQKVKNKAYEVLGKNLHMQTTVGIESKPNIDGADPLDIPEVPKYSTKATESASPVVPAPAPAVRAKALIAPPNSQIDVYGSGWTCKRGFRQVGNECAQVQLPENSQIDVYGSGWTCKRGFRQVGNGCAQVQLPENSQLDVYGSGWTCKRGFRQVGNECAQIFIAN